MIKDLPEYSDIKKMSFAELFKLKKSLKDKLKVRKARYKKELEKADATAKRIPNPQTAFENLEVTGDAFTAKGTKLEILILEHYLREVEVHFKKYKDYIKAHTKQPGDDK